MPIPGGEVSDRLAKDVHDVASGVRSHDVVPVLHHEDGHVNHDGLDERSAVLRLPLPKTPLEYQPATGRDEVIRIRRARYSVL